MMVVRVLFLACAVIVGGANTVMKSEARVLTDAEFKASHEKSRRNAIVFFVARGDANACGQGCSEWIAAEGDFDRTAGKRFQEFIESPGRRDLPIFFHSPGGYTQEARAVALILRANRMRAGVGRTIPEGCPSAVADDATCRRSIQTKSEVKARLVTADAKCSSACGVALMGASFRKVAPDAHIRIHTFAIKDRAWKVEDANFWDKRFLLHMGIDPGFIDLVSTIPYERLRSMSRDEIARFGIETRGFFQTQWALDKDSERQGAGQFTLRKSVNQPEPAESGEYYTTRVIIACPDAWGMPFVYRRELSKGEGKGRAVIRLSDQDLALQPYIADMKDTEAQITRASVDQLRKAAAKPTIEVAEELSLQGGSKPRVTSLSTAGFSEAFEKLLRLCEANTKSQRPGQATAR